MAAFVKIEHFVEALAHKLHDLESDQIVVALSNSAPTVGTDEVIGDIAEISYTNCSSRNVVTSASIQVSGTYKLTLTDLVLTASGGTVGPFRYVILYNDTSTLDNLIGYYDYGSSITLNDGETLTIDFSDANGVLTIA